MAPAENGELDYRLVEDEVVSGETTVRDAYTIRNRRKLGFCVGLPIQDHSASVGSDENGTIGEVHQDWELVSVD